MGRGGLRSQRHERHHADRRLPGLPLTTTSLSRPALSSGIQLSTLLRHLARSLVISAWIDDVASPQHLRVATCSPNDASECCGAVWFTSNYRVGTSSCQASVSVQTPACSFLVRAASCQKPSVTMSRNKLDPDPQPTGRPQAETSTSTASWAAVRGREVCACTGGAPPRAQASADYFSGQLGIRDVRAGLTPEDKLSAVRSLRSDAPAGRSVRAPSAIRTRQIPFC